MFCFVLFGCFVCVLSFVFPAESALRFISPKSTCSIQTFILFNPVLCFHVLSMVTPFVSRLFYCQNKQTSRMLFFVFPPHPNLLPFCRGRGTVFVIHMSIYTGRSDWLFQPRNRFKAGHRLKFEKACVAIEYARKPSECRRKKTRVITGLNGMLLSAFFSFCHFFLSLFVVKTVLVCFWLICVKNPSSRV